MHISLLLQFLFGLFIPSESLLNILRENCSVWSSLLFDILKIGVHFFLLHVTVFHGTLICIMSFLTTDKTNYFIIETMLMYTLKDFIEFFFGNLIFLAVSWLVASFTTTMANRYFGLVFESQLLLQLVLTVRLRIGEVFLYVFFLLFTGEILGIREISNLFKWCLIINNDRI